MRMTKKKKKNRGGFYIGFFFFNLPLFVRKWSFHTHVVPAINGLITLISHHTLKSSDNIFL